MSKIAVLGYGTVGSGVVEVFRTNVESIAQKIGEPVEVRYVLDLREFPGDPVEDVLVHDYEIILQDPEIEVVVETMGGLNPAYPFTKAALEAGKSVCTSNKELVAEHGVELLEIAKEKNVNYFFEASCGGGIPIIRALNESLVADEVEGISGILNGTTNYILTKMTEEGLAFEDALREAQENGYAERDPRADIEGHDVQRKLAILSSIAYGAHVDYRDIPTEGIAKITQEDIQNAKAQGARIKLLAMSRLEGETVYAKVAPVLVMQDSPLYAVNDVYNAVLVRSNMLGESVFYGSGAGKLPTASAVAADVVQAVKSRGKHQPLYQCGKTLRVAAFTE